MGHAAHRLGLSFEQRSGVHRKRRYRADKHPAGPIVFALADGSRPAESLERMLELARVLDTELHLVQVVGCSPVPSSAFPDLLHVMRSAEPALQADRALREWLTQAFPAQPLADRLRTRPGGLVQQVAAHAAELRASLIVMLPDAPGLGKIATNLACLAGVPVLVARPPTFEDTIVAATDLEDRKNRVLRAATRLGRRLHAPVIALHNVSPVAGFGALDIAWPTATGANRALAEAGRERLCRAVERLHRRAVPIVGDAGDPADAILDESRARHVGLIIVGARRRSWLERFLTGSVARRVVNQAPCSVLVVPLTAGDRAGAGSLVGP